MIMTQQDLLALFEQTTGQKNVLTIPRLLIDFTGSVEGGLFLSQLLYWSSRSKNNGWIYKTYSDWKDEVCLSEYQIRKISKQMKESGYLETKLKKINGSPTLHYRLKMDEFSESILKFLRFHSVVFSDSINTEITTETTYINKESENINSTLNTTENTEIKESNKDITTNKEKKVNNVITPDEKKKLIKDLRSYLQKESKRLHGSQYYHDIKEVGSLENIIKRASINSKDINDVKLNIGKKIKTLIHWIEHPDSDFKANMSLCPSSIITHWNRLQMKRDVKKKFNTESYYKDLE